MASFSSFYLPKWPLLQLTTSTYIGSGAAYVVTMYTSGSGTRPLAKSWDLFVSRTTRTIATLWRCAVQCIGNGASLGELWKKRLSFRLSRTPWLQSIVDFVTRLLIMRHRAPWRILIYASPFKNNYFSGNLLSAVSHSQKDSPDSCVILRQGESQVSSPLIQHLCYFFLCLNFHPQLPRGMESSRETLKGWHRWRGVLLQGKLEVELVALSL